MGKPLLTIIFWTSLVSVSVAQGPQNVRIKVEKKDGKTVVEVIQSRRFDGVDDALVWLKKQCPRWKEKPTVTLDIEVEPQTANLAKMYDNIRSSIPHRKVTIETSAIYLDQIKNLGPYIDGMKVIHFGRRLGKYYEEQFGEGATDKIWSDLRRALREARPFLSLNLALSLPNKKAANGGPTWFANVAADKKLSTNELRVWMAQGIDEKHDIETRRMFVDNLAKFGERRAIEFCLAIAGDSDLPLWLRGTGLRAIYRIRNHDKILAGKMGAMVMVPRKETGDNKTRLRERLESTRQWWMSAKSKFPEQVFPKGFDWKWEASNVKGGQETIPSETDYKVDVNAHFEQTTSADLEAVAFDAEGKIGLTVGGIDADTRATIIRSDDSGVTWKQVPCNMRSHLHTVQFVDQGVACAGGTGGVILRSTDHGAQWKRVRSGQGVVTGIGFSTPKIGFAVGNSEQGAFLLRSNDRGATWASTALPQNLSSTIKLGSIAFRNAMTGIILGSKGVFMVTHDGGQSWSVQTQGRQDLRSSCYVGDSDIWIVGDNATLLHSVADLHSWQEIPFPSKVNLTNIRFITESMAIVTSEDGKIFETRNAGKDWRLSFEAVNGQPLGGLYPPHVDHLGVAVGAKGAILDLRLRK